jgi:tetratricopeptide (TPR) repeat protein
MADFLHDSDETLMRYLDGEMDVSEKRAFESQLQKDAALKERLQSLRIAIASVQQLGTTEKVRAIHTEMMQELSSVYKEGKVVPMKKIIRYSLAVAASVIVILVGVNLFTSSSLSSEKLYNEAFVDFDASGVRGKTTETSISKLYQEHKYENVVKQSQLGQLAPADTLLVGLSYLKTNKNDEAINSFKSVSAQNPLKQDAEFYLALAYLKSKNYNEALSLMENIRSNSTHIYHNQFSDEYIDKVKKLSVK